MQDGRTYKVYMHTFPNGKVYIGITAQKTWARWQGGNGYKPQPIMWRAIQKYGWKNVRHAVICDGLTKEEAEAMEIDLIRKHRSTNRRYGYNIANGGNSHGKFSEETKRKMSENMSGSGNPFCGLHLTDEHKKKIRETRKERDIQPVNKRPVRCVETGIIYESTAEASRDTGVHNYALRRVCYGERKTAGGYHWEYVSA